MWTFSHLEGASDPSSLPVWVWWGCMSVKPNNDHSICFSLRAQYGKESYVNALHGSDSTETAMRLVIFLLYIGLIIMLYSLQPTFHIEVCISCNQLPNSVSYSRELAFFFPTFKVPTLPQTGRKPKIQRTLALIRPDALRDRKGTQSHTHTPVYRCTQFNEYIL